MFLACSSFFIYQLIWIFSTLSGMKRIAYVTDVHLDESYITEQGIDPGNNWKRILADIKNRGIQEIIFGGDIGLEESYAYFFESLKAFDLKLTLGNHDQSQLIRKYFPNYFNKGSDELYYLIEDAQRRFIFLDSSSFEISSAQLKFIKESIETDHSIFVFIHHPLIKVDTPVDAQYPLQNRQAVMDLFMAIDQPIHVFCGHYHMEDQRSVANVQQVITMAASYQLNKTAPVIETGSKDFGYRILSFNDKDVRTELVQFVL